MKVPAGTRGERFYRLEDNDPWERHGNTAVTPAASIRHGVLINATPVPRYRRMTAVLDAEPIGTAKTYAMR